MYRIATLVVIGAFSLIGKNLAQASTFEIEGIYQQTQYGVYNGLYSSAVGVWIQNGSPGAPDYGSGVGIVAEAVVDIGSLLGEVVDIVVERNAAYVTHEEVWERIAFNISTFMNEVHNGWFLEYNEYTPELGQYSYGAPNEFERYIVFRHIGGVENVTWDKWDNYSNDQQNDALIFLIDLYDLLDFDHDGRVDPDEILIWDGRTGGSYPNDYKPSVASPVTVPKGSGFYLHAGIGRQGGPIPVLSIKDRFTLGEVVQLASDTPSTLNFTAERADPYGYYRWIYIVQHSTDLETWSNQAHYFGDGQAVAHPIAADGKGFWRILIANEKDYRAFDLAPADQTISAPTQTFSWKGAEAAISYELYLSTDADIDSSDLIGTSTAPSFNFSSLGSGSTYYWKVVAVFEDELRVTSEVASFTTSAL